MASLGGLAQQLPVGQCYHRLHPHHAHHSLRPRPQSLRSVRTYAHLQVKALSSNEFFDRELEQSRLLDQLMQSPSNVLVIVGPRNSGKSRLLEEVLLKKHKALVAFVDGRAQKLTDAAIMTSALRKQAKEQLTAVRQVVERGQDNIGKATAIAASGASLISKLMPGVPVKPILDVCDSVAKQFGESEPRSLNDVLEAYDSLLKLNRTVISKASPLPVICIDEANVLMEWDKGGAAMGFDLDALLRFFVRATKQSCQAHVILATSEYSFITWLTDRLGVDIFEVQVIGDFPEAEARLFLEQIMGATITEAEWAEIFGVCGGNAGRLRSAVQHFSTLKDWTRALNEVWRRRLNQVLVGLVGGPGWSAAQYKTVVQRLVEAAHGAAIAVDLYSELGTDVEAAKAAVEAMVKANILAYRPASEWARDIPSEAFGPNYADVVTAPSATHLYCMRRLQRRGVLKSTAEAVPTPSPAALEPSPLKQQLKEVDQQLKDAGKKVDEVEKAMKDLRSARLEGWQDEITYLREEKKQLREEMTQLRREKEQLREERLLLLRKSDT